jgi:hypothetical protein
MARWLYEETTYGRLRPLPEQSGRGGGTDPGAGAMILGAIFWIGLFALILKGCCS